MTSSHSLACPSLDSFSLLTLAHPSAFSRWCQEVLVEDLYAVHDLGLQDTDLHVVTHDSTIVVTGTAHIPCWNKTGTYPTEVLKNRIVERFGATHPLANALIIWNVVEENRLDGRDAFVASEPIVVSAVVTQGALTRALADAQTTVAALNADGWTSAIVTVKPGCKASELDITTHKTRAWWRNDYEGYLHSTFGRAGWSVSIAGRAKLCPERIVTAFTHILSDLIRLMGLAETVGVRVTLNPGDNALKKISVTLEGRQDGLAAQLSEKLSAWAPKCEALWTDWHLDELNWVSLVERNATGPTIHDLPIAGAVSAKTTIEALVKEVSGE